MGKSGENWGNILRRLAAILLAIFLAVPNIEMAVHAEENTVFSESTDGEKEIEMPEKTQSGQVLKTDEENQNNEDIQEIQSDDMGNREESLQETAEEAQSAFLSANEDAGEDLEQLNFGVNEIAVSNQQFSKRFMFLPEEEGSYIFKVYSDMDSLEGYAYLYNAGGGLENKVVVNNNLETVKYVHSWLESGETAYLRLDLNNFSGFVYVEIVKAVQISDIKLIKKPDKLNYLIETDAFDSTGLEVLVTYENGLQEEITDVRQPLSDGREICRYADYYDSAGTYTITFTDGRISTSFDINVLSKEDYLSELDTVEVGKETVLSFEKNEVLKEMKFAAEMDGTYQVTITPEEGVLMPGSTIKFYKSNGYTLCSVADFNMGKSIETTLIEPQVDTMRFVIRRTEQNSGNVKVFIKKIKTVKALSVVTLPEQTKLVYGNGFTYTFSDMEVQLTFSDGTTEILTPGVTDEEGRTLRTYFPPVSGPGVYPVTVSLLHYENILSDQFYVEYISAEEYFKTATELNFLEQQEIELKSNDVLYAIQIPEDGDYLLRVKKLNSYYPRMTLYDSTYQPLSAKIVIPAGDTNDTMEYQYVDSLIAGTYYLRLSRMNEQNVSFRIQLRFQNDKSITYVLNGGKNNEENPTEVGDYDIVLKEPTRKGYTFGGWYTDSEFTKKVTMVSSDTKTGYTLYAKWTANKYTIKFSGNGNTSGSMSSVASCKYGTSYTLPANTYKRKGYTFTGWNTKADGSGTTYANKATVKNLSSKSGGSVTLYAQWKLSKYSITYDLKRGNNNSNNPASYAVTTATITLKNPTRKGYTFGGWYTENAYKNKVTQIKKGSTGNKTFYAKWTANKYTIKFSGNGSTSGSMSSVASCKYGTSYTLPANTYKRKGYTFTGWNTKADGSGTTYANKATVKNLSSKSGGSVTLYAQWKLSKYSITYDLKGGNNSSNNPANYTVTTATITLKNPTRKGYTFGGWYTENTYKNKVTQIKKGSTGNKIFYAKWTANKYTIKFSGNGSTSGSMSSAASCKYGTSYTLPANTYKRKGYTFIGWNTKVDGSGTTYANKATVKNLSSKSGGSVTLYAQWKKNKK